MGQVKNPTHKQQHKTKVNMTESYIWQRQGWPKMYWGNLSMFGFKEQEEPVPGSMTMEIVYSAGKEGDTFINPPSNTQWYVKSIAR